MNEKKYQQLAELFKSVGEINRLKILVYLMEQEMNVTTLAEKFNCGVSNISHQLRLLKTVNLVTSRKEGKEVYYQLADDHVKVILQTGLDHILENERN